MYQLVKDGQKWANFDTEKDARRNYEMLKRCYKNSDIKVFHKTAPTKPSEIPLPGSCGARNDVFSGWHKLESSTIKGDGFTVTFERLGERVIDIMCDALNGWYTEWTKFRVTFSDKLGKIEIVTRTPEIADRIFGFVTEATPCNDPGDEMTIAEVVRTVFTAIVNFTK